MAFPTQQYNANKTNSRQIFGLHVCSAIVFRITRQAVLCAVPLRQDFKLGKVGRYQRKLSTETGIVIGYLVYNIVVYHDLHCYGTQSGVGDYDITHIMPFIDL